MIINYICDEKDDGLLLKNIIKTRLHVSNVLKFNLVKFKKIFLNEDNNIFLSTKVTNNDKIQIVLDSQSDCNSSLKNFNNKFNTYNFKLDILYEDEYLLIVNKPYNMESHPSSSNYCTTLSNAVLNYLLKQNISTIHLVTRLDKNTSGICIFAKHKYIQELFIRKKETINFKKEYIAIVNGILKKDKDIITSNICRSENSIILRKVCSSDIGETAITEYKIKTRNYEKNYSVLDIILHTGRTHQIRVHLSSIGHVLLGDELYAKEYLISNIKKLIDRQALHSYKISFFHPITNKKIEIKCTPPDDMKKLIN